MITFARFYLSTMLVLLILFASAVRSQSVPSCNGDYNASVVNCPVAFPSTCSKPNAEFGGALYPELSVCECNPGYLLTKTNGICIKPEDCPGGNVCGQNEYFVSCVFQCPDMYCPVDDGPQIACRQPRCCLSGCRCQRNYLRKSINDYTCILASECPSVTCTRPNEEWSGCQIPCFSDYCSDRNKPPPKFCPAPVSHCMPRCICKKGFYRNQSGICIPAKYCPPVNLY